MAAFFRRKTKRVVVDVDTQYDLMATNGRDHSEQLKHVRRMMAWARRRHVPVVSTALCQRVPAHGELLCVEGTPGQRKIGYTLIGSRIIFGPEKSFDLPPNLLQDYSQVIFEKRTEDPFDQPRADRFFTENKADEYIVLGMGLTRALKATVLGLLARGKKVIVITDAIDLFNDRESQLALRQVEAKGAKLMTTDALTGKSHLTGKAIPRYYELMVSVHCS